MNWDAIGAVGELLGAVAVILTLVYLASQIRQNTATSLATTYSATTNGWHDYLQSQSVEDLDLIIEAEGYAPYVEHSSRMVNGAFHLIMGGNHNHRDIALLHVGLDGFQC